MGTLRVGLVGAGGVGERHAATLASLGEVRLAAVTDVDAARAGAVAELYGARACPDLSALLSDGQLDAVWLCVPPFAHGDAERMLIEAGIPFFVEKPLAASLAVAEELAAAVEARGLLTATGYHWRYMPGVERAVDALGGRTLRLAAGAWLDKLPPVGWWSRRELSGGQVIEQATHLVDTMRVFLGEPVSVWAQATAMPGRDEALVDAATSATLSFSSGAVASLVATSVLTWKQGASLTLVGDGAMVEVGEAQTVIRIGEDTEVVTDDGISKRRVDAEFCDAVRRGDPAGIRVPYAEALKTHRVGCALEESARTGKPVMLRPQDG